MPPEAFLKQDNPLKEREDMEIQHHWVISAAQEVGIIQVFSNEPFHFIWDMFHLVKSWQMRELT